MNGDGVTHVCRTHMHTPCLCAFTELNKQNRGTQEVTPETSRHTHTHTQNEVMNSLPQ